MSKLKFEDPGRKGVAGNTKEEYDDAVQQLRERPGEWALVSHSPNISSHPRPYASRGCETATRKQPDGSYKVYARWNPA